MNLPFDTFVENMPAGLVITDNQLEAVYMNGYARDRIFGLRPGQDRSDVMLHHRFYSTDRQLFDMGGCMRQMVAGKRRMFHKTLVLKGDTGDKLVYFTARGISMEGLDHYVFVMADITSEMDCFTHPPGRRIGEEFILSQHIIGSDKRIRDVYRLISLAADSTVNVVLTGESGTGKELAADAIHALSPRKEKPMVKVNCSALSESLLESELFGHVKGAFTGAIRDKRGKFEEAQGGTLFLDEIGELGPALQVKLLRVIQEKTIERVGSNIPIVVDMRIIAATNRDLQEMVRGGSFREDLFYRLNVFSIHMPPLRERILDIPRLCDHFTGVYNDTTGKQVKGLTKEALRRMMHYHWPGNIRELQNAIEYAFVLVQGSVIGTEDLPDAIAGLRTGDNPVMDRVNAPGAAASGETMPYKTRGGRLNISREQLVQVLSDHGWNQTRAAETLGVSRVSLWKKMKKLGI